MNTPNHEQTPDSYDAHIIPAETAARREREGDNYKQVPQETEDTATVHNTSGYTVDQEGLANNYAIEPEMYADNPSKLTQKNPALMTIVDIFGSQAEAQKAVLGMQEAGLTSNKVTLLAKENEDSANGNLAVVLTQLGIAENQAEQYANALEDGKFVVVVTGSDRDVSQALHVLQKMGHQTIAS